MVAKGCQVALFNVFIGVLRNTNPEQLNAVIQKFLEVQPLLQNHFSLSDHTRSIVKLTPG